MAKHRTAGEKIQRGVTFIAGLFVVGIIVVSVMLARSIPAAVAKSGVAVGITALLLFFAAGALGAGVGFLFGLPRARYADQAATAGADGAPPTTGNARPSAFLANTNLVKVSDWLTTIVIGLGLVNLAKLGPAASNLRDALQEPLGGSPNAGVIGVATVIVGLLAGMLLTYLWTSTRVRELFEQTETEAAEGVVPALVRGTVGEAKAKMAATALTLAVPEGAADVAVVTKQSSPAGTPLPAGTVVSIEIDRKQ
jgi:hypothetical protein